MAGLGSSESHGYMDVSFLNARLRPIMPKGVGMGNGSLSGNSLGIVRGFGAEPDYPWGEYSANTKALQESTNDALRIRGYMPLKTDGKLGAKTCGAIRQICTDTGQPCDGPDTCQSFTAPSKLGGSPMLATKASSPVARTSMFGGGGGTNWLLVGAAVGAIALGGALIFRGMKT
jgi:hypothetical protein